MAGFYIFSADSDSQGVKGPVICKQTLQRKMSSSDSSSNNSSSSSDSDSDLSGEEVKESIVDPSQLDRLQMQVPHILISQVEANEYNFEFHTEYINLCKKAGDPERTHAARVFLHSKIPLTEGWSH